MLLIPNVDASRTEARIGEAYRNVLQLVNAQHVKQQFGEGDSSAIVELPDIDPWDTPYRATIVNDKLRVGSAGPNQSFESSGEEKDDIFSDMPVSPIELIHSRKRQQFLVAIAVTVATWGIMTSLYLWTRKNQSN
jgi:hypothetical protein